MDTRWHPLDDCSTSSGIVRKGRPTKQVVLAHAMHIEDARKIPGVSFAITKGCLEGMKSACSHVKSFDSMRGCEVWQSALLDGEDTFFQPCLASRQV